VTPPSQTKSSAREIVWGFLLHKMLRITCSYFTKVIIDDAKKARCLFNAFLVIANA
jgi:hypothetical protein